MTEAALKWRVDSGRWVRLHEGVFLTRPGRAEWQLTALATLLVVDSARRVGDAALCGATAAYLWGIASRAPRTLELVVPLRRAVKAPPGASVRRSSRWDDLVDDMAYPWRTTVPVTVLDVAGSGSAADALAVVSRAVQKELTTTSLLRQELGRRRGHRHGKLLASALVDVEEGGESGAEVLFIRDVERAHGLPAARRQSASDQGRRRYHDNEYDGFGLLVEVDGRLGHERWTDRVRDGQRDRQVLAQERVTTRVFWADVAITPCQTAVDVAAILRTRGWSGAARACRRSSCAVRAAR
jgi:hypothetical protein